MVLARVALLSRRLARHASTRALMHYQSDHVPRSLTSTGRVGTRRDLAGSDAEFFGVDPAPTRVDIEDGRGAGFARIANHGHRWLGPAGRRRHRLRRGSKRSAWGRSLLKLVFQQRLIL